MVAQVKRLTLWLVARQGLGKGKKPKKISKLLWLLLLGLPSLEVVFFPASAIGQTIAPARDGTGTIVTPVSVSPIRFDISGGSLSSDRANLFHSFQQFNLTDGQIANFISNPAIRNILARISGGGVSVINGLITVTGGNSNLFLMNPSGIIFGSNASLNVPADFTATTAARIGLNGGWFNANSPNNYQLLVGEPSTFSMANLPTQSDTRSGEIFNAGNLAVKPGQILNLLGSRVINQGKLEAPGGQINVVEVPGESIIRISQPGHLLNLELETPEKSLSAVNLPQLLTGGSSENATAAQVNNDGKIVLSKPENLGNHLETRAFPLTSSPLAPPNIIIPNEAEFKAHSLTITLPKLEVNGNLSSPEATPILISPPGINGGFGEKPSLGTGSFFSRSGAPQAVSEGPNLPPLEAKLDNKLLVSGSSLPMERVPNNNGFSRRPLDGSPPKIFGDPKFNPSSSGVPSLEIAAASSLVMRREQQFANEFGDKLLNSQVTPQSIRETLGKITAETGNRAAIIYITAFTEQLELIVVTPDGTTINKTVPAASRVKLLAMARNFREQVTNPRRLESTSYLASAQQLYQWLIAPLEETLQKHGINTLLFSMDGGLRSLPLAALHDGKHFLIEKYSFSLIPSLSLTDTRYQSLKNASVLAMGASQFQELSPLPAVPVELSMIVGNLWSGKTFINQDFTLKNLKVQRSEYPYQIIHLATHGEFNLGAANNSYIQLWDTKLRLDQMRQLGWQNPPVELLVLSACRTGVGDEENELGFAGLAFQAGVKSALASLWYVSDEGTLALMSEFYRNLKTAPIKAEALREAQLALLTGKVRIEAGRLQDSIVVGSVPGTRGGVGLPSSIREGNPNLRHPYYWSAFMMVGSPW